VSRHFLEKSEEFRKKPPRDTVAEKPDANNPAANSDVIYVNLAIIAYRYSLM